MFTPDSIVSNGELKCSLKNKLNLTPNSSNGNISYNIDINGDHKRNIKRVLPIRMKNSDPAECLDILDDMYSFFFDMQHEYAATCCIMKFQNDINYKMRSILVDWLVQVHHKLQFTPATLFLCINIVDRYLQKRVIMRKDLQLVGVSALLISSKFEEINPLSVNKCVEITANSYYREDVIQMEFWILEDLNFDIAVPTAFHFLSLYLNRIKAYPILRYLAFYYAERNLQEALVLTVKPHLYAAAAVYAALRQQIPENYFIENENAITWPIVLQEESGLQEFELEEFASQLINHVSEETITTSKRILNSCKRKYASKHFENIASLKLPFFY